MPLSWKHNRLRHTPRLAPFVREHDPSYPAKEDFRVEVDQEREVKASRSQVGHGLCHVDGRYRVDRLQFDEYGVRDYQIEPPRADEVLLVDDLYSLLTSERNPTQSQLD